MREIKFRAWDEKIKHMFACDSGKHALLITFDGKIVDSGVPFTSQIKIHDDLVLMQFTGIKDRNGKEIYEGDIVKLMHRKNEKGGWISNSNEIGKVEFNSDWGVRFYCKDKTQRTSIHWRAEGNKFSEASEVEVIGNIYQNKELLNE